MATGNLLGEGNINKACVINFDINPQSVGANTTGQSTITVPGVKLGDMCFLNVPTASFNQGLGCVNAYVSAADTVIVRWMNATAGALDAPNMTCHLFLIRPDATLTGTGWIY
jgi:hypothetical protein